MIGQLAQFLRTNIYTVLVQRIGIVMGLYMMSRIAFYVINLEFYRNISLDQLLTMCLGGIQFDLSAVMYINVLYILAFALPFNYRFNTKFEYIAKYFFLVTNGIALAGNAMDMIYYKFTLKRSTAITFDLLANEDNLGAIFIRSLSGYWYLTVFFIALMWVFRWLYDRTTIEPLIHLSNTKRLALNTLVFVAIGVLVVAGMRGGFRHSTRPIAMSNAGAYVDAPDQMAIVLNSPFSIFRTLGKARLQALNHFSEEDLTKVFNPIYKGEKGEEFKELNVVVLILESFGREYMGTFNQHLEDGTYTGFTPFLDSLMSESQSYWYGMANGRKSIDALPSVITSIPAFYYPFILSPYAGNEFNSIAGLLKNKGYSSGFFHGGHNGSMGFNAFMNLAKFDRYYGFNEFGDASKSDGTWGIWDEEFFQYFAHEMNGMKQPFVTTLFSLSSHHPFEVPDRYEGQFKKGPLEIHEMVGYSDNALRQFFKSVEKMDWYENTLFVITADHASQVHYDEYANLMGFVQIPIMFYRPTGELKGMDTTFAQQIDILPTVLRYMNYDEDFYAFGNDLFDSLRSKSAVMHINGSETFMYFEEDWMMYKSNQGAVKGLYNFKKDKFAKHDLQATNSAVTLKMDKKINAILQTYHHGMIENKLIVK